MNGEPREGTPESAVPTITQEAERPLLGAINTDRVTKTTVTADRQLAPLFTQQATTDFRARWDSVQKSFVDDPKQAVQSADELVAQVTQTLNETFASQRADLEKSFDGADVPSTENLRLALRQYRAFFERLLSI